MLCALGAVHHCHSVLSAMDRHTPTVRRYMTPRNNRPHNAEAVHRHHASAPPVAGPSDRDFRPPPRRNDIVVREVYERTPLTARPETYAYQYFDERGYERPQYYPHPPEPTPYYPEEAYHNRRALPPTTSVPPPRAYVEDRDDRPIRQQQGVWYPEESHDRPARYHAPQYEKRADRDDRYYAAPPSRDRRDYPSDNHPRSAHSQPTLPPASCSTLASSAHASAESKTAISAFSATENCTILPHFVTMRREELVRSIPKQRLAQLADVKEGMVTRGYFGALIFNRRLKSSERSALFDLIKRMKKKGGSTGVPALRCEWAAESRDELDFLLNEEYEQFYTKARDPMLETPIGDARHLALYSLSGLSTARLGRGVTSMIKAADDEHESQPPTSSSTSDRPYKEDYESPTPGVLLGKRKCVENNHVTFKRIKTPADQVTATSTSTSTTPVTSVCEDAASLPTPPNMNYSPSPENMGDTAGADEATSPVHDECDEKIDVELMEMYDDDGVDESEDDRSDSRK